MNREEFFNKMGLPPDTLPGAIDQLDVCQSAMLDMVERLARERNAELTPILHQTAQATHSAYEYALSAVLENPELDINERARCLAGIIVCSDVIRVRHFRELAPDATFYDLNNMHAKATQKVKRSLKRRVPTEEIRASLMQEYFAGLKNDSETLYAELNLDTI